MASVVAVGVALVVIWGSPLIYVERAKLLNSTGIQTIVQTIMPGRFQYIGNKVFYVQSMNRDHNQAEQIFLAQHSVRDGQTLWDILWADKAYAKTDVSTGEDYLVFNKGKMVEGIPGRADYQIVEFSQYQRRLPHRKLSIENDVRTHSSYSLLPLNNPDPKKAAELQWRLSIPIMVLTLTLIAVPLSRINPRAGKYAKLLPALLIFILYANAMFVARDAVSSAKVPVWLGMWWIHGLVLILACVLLWRNHVKLS